MRFAHRVVPLLFAGSLWPAAAQQATPSPMSPLVGATVFASDSMLVGSIDAVLDSKDGKNLVIGLAGYLDVGEKDVIVPAAVMTEVRQKTDLPRHFNLGEYGGGALARVRLSMPLQDILRAPAYVATHGETGTPSPHVGAPTEGAEKAPSSKHSGGPG